MTLYSAFLTTEIESPALMFSIEAPVFLRLFDAGVHEHGAAAAQVDGAVRKKAEGPRTP